MQENRNHLKYLQENGLNEQNYFHGGGADNGGGWGGVVDLQKQD